MISSRISKTKPSQCPLCSAETGRDFSQLGGDAYCPRCGVQVERATLLLARLQTLARQHPDLEVTEITAASPWPLGGDSLTAVEVMLALERDLGVNISAHAAERIYTVGEAIRYFEHHLRQRKVDQSAGP